MNDEKSELLKNGAKRIMIAKQSADCHKWILNVKCILKRSPSNFISLFTVVQVVGAHASVPRITMKDKVHARLIRTGTRHWKWKRAIWQQVDLFSVP